MPHQWLLLEPQAVLFLTMPNLTPILATSLLIKTQRNDNSSKMQCRSAVETGCGLEFISLKPAKASTALVFAALLGVARSLYRMVRSVSRLFAAFSLPSSVL